MTELEVTARASNVLTARIKQAAFPAHKDLDSYDFSAMPAVSKPKILELTRGEWLDQRLNVILVGAGCHAFAKRKHASYLWLYGGKKVSQWPRAMVVCSDGSMHLACFCKQKHGTRRIMR